MIWDTRLSSIADDEIRREISGTADILNRPVNKVIALVEREEMARNVIPQPETPAVSALKRNASTVPIRSVISQRVLATPFVNRSKQSYCPKCNALFSKFKRGPRGWNQKPYSMFLLCFKASRRNRQKLHCNF